jgi:hypothetical protein
LLLSVEASLGCFCLTGDGVAKLGGGVATTRKPYSLRHRRGSRTNLVDPASSHMLVSKIKPCMSQHKFLHGEAANGSLKVFECTL